MVEAKQDPAASGLPISGAADMAVPFSFQDVRVMAARILRVANEQAQRKLDAANEQGKQIEHVAYDDGHKKGYDEGYPKGEAEGRTEGNAAAQQAFAERTQALTPTLEALLKELEERKVALQAQAEADLLQLAMEIARRIVRNELHTDRNAVIPVVREAIGLATNRSDLAIHIHPDDMNALEEELPHIRQAFSDLGKVHLDPDTSIERGGVRVVGREGEIDMRLDQQFAALERALIGDQSNETPSEPDAS